MAIVGIISLLVGINYLFVFPVALNRVVREQGLGPTWTPEVKAAWQSAYSLLAAVMRNAAREAITSIAVVADLTR